MDGAQVGAFNGKEWVVDPIFYATEWARVCNN